MKNSYFLAILSTIIWGLTFVSTKLLLNNGLSSSEIMLYRFAIAYLCMLPLSKRPFFAKNIKDELTFAAAGLAGGSLYFVTENMALQVSMTSNVAIIIASSPIFTIILSHLLIKGERLTKKFLINSLVTFAGVILVICNGHFVLQLNPLGDILALIAALSWAFYIVILKRVDGKYPIMMITRKVFFYGIVTLLPVFNFIPANITTDMLKMPQIWLHLIFLSVFASFLCFVAWNYVVKTLGTMKTSNFIYIVPLVSLLAAVFILKEPITPLAILGVVLIMLGVIRGTKLT